MLTTVQLGTMLELQAQINDKTNPGWVTNGTPYLRAVIVEGAEGMEHHGWKWWKKQVLDSAQLQMELVDIFHFYLSHSMQAFHGERDAATAAIRMQLGSAYAREGIMFDGRYYTFAQMDTLSRLELLTGLAVSRRASYPLFELLMIDVGMSHDDLYRQYVGKNVLNNFRQDFGYKTGEYMKIWNGREDNEHLVEILNEMDMKDAMFATTLYTALKDRYLRILASVAV